jgi:hypothetical protein
MSFFFTTRGLYFSRIRATGNPHPAKHKEQPMANSDPASTGPLAGVPKGMDVESIILSFKNQLTYTMAKDQLQPRPIGTTSSASP